MVKMSLAVEETSQRHRKRSKHRHHERKHHSDEAANVDDVSNQGVSDQPCGRLDEQELVNQLENEDMQSSFNMHNILGRFLATKLQVIESENQTVSKSTISSKRSKNKLSKDKHRKSSSKKSSKRSSNLSDARANDEFEYDKNANDFGSDSKNPKSLDFLNYSEHPSNYAMLDRTRLKNVREDHSQSHQGCETDLQKRLQRISQETVHCDFKSSALKNHNDLDTSYGSGAFPFSDVSSESCNDFPFEFSPEHLPNFKETDNVKSEHRIHRSKRKHSSSKKSKAANESRHRKSKRARIIKDSVEVSTFPNPYFQTDSSHAKATSRCYKDSLCDDVKSVASENDEKDFGFASERHCASRQKSCDYFQPGNRLHKPDNDRDDVGNETWIDRYNKTKSFKHSHSGSISAEADIDPLQYDKYSHLNSNDPNWGHSSKHNRLLCEGKIYTTRGDTSDPLSHNRRKMHSKTKSPISSTKKKSSRKVKHVDKHEKKKHKHRDRSLPKLSHKRKSTKHERRKSKHENKVHAVSNEAVEIVKSSVLPSDDDDNFRPMLIAVENNDEVSELWLGKRTTLQDDSVEQSVRLELDYNAVVACAEKVSVPSRIVKTYKEGIAVSRLLRRVKTRIGPLKQVNRLQATLPRHPVVMIAKHSQAKLTDNDQVQNSTVVQDVEDPGVQQPLTSEVLPTISDVSAEHASDDILQTLPLGVLGEPTVVQAGPGDLIEDKSDPNHENSLTGISQEAVSINLLPESNQLPEQFVNAETSVDPVATVETVATDVAACLRLSSEGEVTCTGFLQTTESETNANDPCQEKSVPEVALEDLVQNIASESSDNLTLHRVSQVSEIACIPHSSEQDKHVETDEVQGNFSVNCDIQPELAFGSCSDGSSQNVGNEEITAVISSNEDRSLEVVVVAVADPSVACGTTFNEATTFDEATDHLADTCKQDEVSIDTQDQKQCLTVEISEITGIGTEMTGIEKSQKEVLEREVTAKEENENEASVNKSCEVEMIGEVVTGKEVCENEAEGNKVDDIEAECHCTEQEMNPENKEVVSRASNSQDMFCIESEVGNTKEIVQCSSQSLSAEQEENMQALKRSFLSNFVRAGCSDIPCNAEPVLESAEGDASKEDGKTVHTTGKKLVRQMGIKISGWSTAFILSGTRYENDPKKRNREEGELTDSSADSSESEDFETAPVHCAFDLQSSGSLSESAEEEFKKPEFKKPEFKKPEFKKPEFKEPEFKKPESRKPKSKKSEFKKPVVGCKSKQEKKHKKSHKKHKKQKRRHSIESTSSDEERSRSRSRSFSVARTFDQEKGVWREKKHKPKKKKVRPRLNIDKERLREIAIKNSLHSQVRFKRPTTKSNELTGIRSGGKSVAELTDFCKTISGKKYCSSSSSEDENGPDGRHRVIDSVEDESETFLTNFMRCRDKDARIVLNIRDSRQLPALTAQEMIAKKAVMRLMYPVSNGSQHRHKEEGWVPVTKPDQEKSLSRPQVPVTDTPLQTITIPSVPPTSAGAAAVELANARAPVPENSLPPLPLNCDVKVILTERLDAIRRLNANPTDAQALEDVVRAQMQMQKWAEEKQIPGQFFTSVLRMGLMGNKLKKHDWLRKTQQGTESGADATGAVLQSDPSGANGATNPNSINPLAGVNPDGTYNIGKLMMLRMGWKENEGLGRQNLGRLQPLCPEMKKDRKGLQAREEITRPLAKVLSVKGKHPVSALLETCARRRIGQPEFILAEETGPSHLKRFLYKVILNGVEYQPNVGSQNKKSAKLEAAASCLDALGLSG